MTLDGKKQRNALTAAEQALRALAAGDAQRARKNAAKAAELDQLGIYGSLRDAVATAAADIEASGAASEASWENLRQAVGPGPLQFLVDELHGGS